MIPEKTETRQNVGIVNFTEALPFRPLWLRFSSPCKAQFFSVLLEWFYPIRNGIMLLLAGIVGTLPRSLFALIILLAAEIAVLLIQCVRC